MDAQTLLASELPGFVFTTIAAVFFLVLRHQNLQRYRIRQELIHKERLAAMEKGIPMPELPDYDDGQLRRTPSLFSMFHINPRWPLGLGSILVVGGIGVTLALHLSRDPEQFRVWSMGLVPIFVGLGLFLHYWLTRAPHDR